MWVMWEICGRYVGLYHFESEERLMNNMNKLCTFSWKVQINSDWSQLSTLLTSVGRWLGRRAIQHLGMQHFRVLWFLDIIWISLYHLSGLSTWFHSISPLITELNSNVDHALCFQGYVGGSCTCSCPIDQDFGRCYPLPNTMTFERWRFGQEAWAWDSTLIDQIQDHVLPRFTLKREVTWCSGVWVSKLAFERHSFVLRLETCLRT